MSELINNMKLCLLCRSANGEYTSDQAVRHAEKGMHHTYLPENKTHNTWAPLKGHEEYDQHLKSRSLGLISTL